MIRKLFRPLTALEMSAVVHSEETSIPEGARCLFDVQEGGHWLVFFVFAFAIFILVVKKTVFWLLGKCVGANSE